MQFEMQKIRTVFFDLDGTLIDNFIAIYRCYADIAREMGLEPKSFERLRATVGGSISMTLSRLIGDDLAPEGVRRFRAHFPDVMFDGVFVFDGAEELLKTLRSRGIACAVFTNKNHDAAVALLQHLGLEKHLDRIFGTDMPEAPWRKPQREFSEFVLREMRTSAENAMLVGDSPFDIQAARAVGMRVACVTTGTHLPEPLIEASGTPEMIFPNLRALGAELFGK